MKYSCHLLIPVRWCQLKYSLQTLQQVYKPVVYNDLESAVNNSCSWTAMWSYKYLSNDGHPKIYHTFLLNTLVLPFGAMYVHGKWNLRSEKQYKKATLWYLSLGTIQATSSQKKKICQHQNCWNLWFCLQIHQYKLVFNNSHIANNS